MPFGWSEIWQPSPQTNQIDEGQYVYQRWIKGRLLEEQVVRPQYGFREYQAAFKLQAALRVRTWALHGLFCYVGLFFNASRRLHICSVAAQIQLGCAKRRLLVLRRAKHRQELEKGGQTSWDAAANERGRHITIRLKIESDLQSAAALCTAEEVEGDVHHAEWLRYIHK